MIRFRWVACQLDALAKCTSLSKLRKALRTLPKTLEETYDRILLSIDPERRSDALKMLQWLAFSVHPLALADMAEVLAIDHTKNIPRFDPDLRLRDPRDVLEICPSLITISYTVFPEGVSQADFDEPIPTDSLSLAHLSVKEYLISEHTNKSLGSFYYLNKKLVDTSMCCECLAYLLHFHTVDPSHDDDFSPPPLGSYAAECWIIHARSDDGVIQDDVQPLIQSFFLADNAVFPPWLSLRGFPLGRHENIPRPLVYASYLGLREVVQQLLQSSSFAEMDAKLTLDTALAVASWRGNVEIVCILLEKGVGTNLMGKYWGSALVLASERGCEAIVRTLFA